jgi:UrcA family protein
MNTIRPLPGASSLLVNLVLFPALLIGLTLPPNARAESPSVTLSAADYVARAHAKSERAYERIRIGAAVACESSRIGVGGPHADAYRKCLEQTIAARVADVNDRGLSAYHRQRSDGPAIARTLAARSE